MKDEEIKFPEGFYWGAATAAHQVEGGQRNDWTEWETSPARMANLERSGLIKKYGKGNFISGLATDHYHLFKEDLRMAKALGHNAARFSLEWSRLEPERGRFDEHEFAHYLGVVRTAKKDGLEPFVTLWHYTLPLWVRDQGGWENRSTIDDFARFVEKVVLILGPEIKFWITINEPEVYAGDAYLAGRKPPQKKNPVAYLRVLRHLAIAHRAAYAVIKQLSPRSLIGIASNQIHFDARSFDPIGKAAAVIADRWWNARFLNRIAHTSDFIGVNHYFHIWTGLWPDRDHYPLSDMNWKLRPASIYPVLMRLKRFGKPIYVTENGLADSKDEHRAWFIRETLNGVHRAIGSGADVRGYLHWALLDNFEWTDGFWPRFGLISVDYETLERKYRPSALAYRDICRGNGITPASKTKG
ncbi:glycoside hydrolase family 1 protein [Patescibacteria group bacterium]|nr:glycoside hydrolase family 1 protein [Patescibacteria group bacterium]